jgi:hypothetical protein
VTIARPAIAGVLSPAPFYTRKRKHVGMVFQAYKHVCIIVFHEATDTRWKLDVEETRDMVRGALMFKEKE